MASRLTILQKIAVFKNTCIGFKKRNLKDGNCRIISGGERAVLIFCTVYIEKLFPPSEKKR